MKKSFIIAASLLSFAPFCSHAQQSMAEKSGVNKAMGVAPIASEFVHNVAISDMFEIQSSKLALQEHVSPKVASFANRMVTDHTNTSSELKSLVMSANIQAEVPQALDSKHQELLDKLRTLHGKKFEAQYREDQIDGHQEAVSLFHRYGSDGDNVALKQWAGKTEPALRHHLDLARQLPE
ncbi:DUF4142 domain-containing protein [Kozakia baliensis]|uniref:DUF4142 domain-containing protein n=1 Tax=Kozakia baliensis TaxID=153496 RepID=UPI00087C4AC5|nr:DUF4142 domain-containing protein [Kozakia baliensis]AOX20195.1 DUF305 domain-containing protein [Kozakia baliensis]